MLAVTLERQSQDCTEGATPKGYRRGKLSGPIQRSTDVLF